MEILHVYIGCSTLVEPCHEITLVCHCFLKIGSLVFSDIVHDDNWTWNLLTDEAGFWNKIKNEVSHHFTEFGFFIFLKIACNDSLRQYLTSSGGKTHKKFFLGGEGGLDQLGPKLGFWPFSEVWYSSFPLNCIVW